MKKTFSLIILFLDFNILYSQTPNFNWAKQLGGPGTAEGYSIFVDAIGNVYTTGTFSNTADFDPGVGTFTLTSFGITDVFISKLDASGNFVWAKQIGGSGDDFAESIAVDASGNVYTIGGFRSICDFDPGTGTFTMSTSCQDIFLSVIDASGNFVWAKQMSGVSGCLGSGVSIAIDNANNIYTTGYFTGAYDFDPGIGTYTLSSIFNNDIFVSKLDPLGNFIWAKQMGGPMSDGAKAIKVDASGNVYTAGFFESIADFDPSPSSFTMVSLPTTGYTDIFISKLDASGNFVWAKQMGGTDNDLAFSLALDPSGNILTTGGFKGTSDFDPGIGTYTLTSSASSNFISKLDPSGNFLWAKQFVTSYLDYAYSVATDASGNIYTTGSFGGTTDFDPGVGTYNLNVPVICQNIFISKLDAAGNFLWAEQMVGSTNAHGNSIFVDVSDNVYTTGFFSASPDFDPGVGTYTIAGGYDAFIHKMSQGPTGVSENVIQNNISVFPNPSNGQLNFLFPNKYSTATIKLFSVTGQTLIEKTILSKDNYSLDISEQVSGIYFIEVNMDGDYSRKKLVKN